MILPPIFSSDQINNNWGSNPKRTSASSPNRVITTAFQELGEPLTALWMGVEYFQDHLPTSHGEGLAYVQANLLELERLTTNLYYLTASPPFICIPGRLESLLQRLVSTWEERFIARHIGLQFQAGVDLPSLSFDANRLSCILNNLFAFCFKTLSGGDRLYLTLTSDDQAQMINFICDHLSIKKADSASPIAESAFQSLEDKTWLLLTRHLIEEHHGRFHIQFETGWSETFSIYLPEIIT
jgi:hypothetical protein